jgi:hypothetical protein
MAAHSAHLSAQLPRAAGQRSLPAINGFHRLGCGGQRAGAPLSVHFSRAAPGLSLPAVLRRPASISPIVAAASSYENGFGSVGKLDDQLDLPAVDSASVQATGGFYSPHPYHSSKSPPESGAPTVKMRRYSTLMMKWMSRSVSGKNCRQIHSVNIETGNRYGYVITGGDARIKVFGVGGGGNNAVNRMINSGLQVGTSEQADDHVFCLSSSFWRNCRFRCIGDACK